VAGGVPLALAPGSDRGPTFAEHIGLTYMPVDATDERIRVICFDPPVLQIEGFVDDAVCDALITAAQASGMMAPSAVGPGKVGDVGGDAMSERRTSSTLLVDDGVLNAHPQLKVCLVLNHEGGVPLSLILTTATCADQGNPVFPCTKQ
jgi:hypothetical protein